MIHIDLKKEIDEISELENAALIANTKNLIKDEKRCIIRALLHLMVIYHRKLFLLAGYSSLGQYCVEELKLSNNKAWKRAQAVKIIGRFPELLGMLKREEISVSHSALLVPKITEANQNVIYKGIKGTSKKEAEFFLSQVTCDGTIKDKEPEVEIRFNCKESLSKKLERVRELLLGKDGKKNLSDLFEVLVDFYLEKNDPMEKALRAQKREQEKAVMPEGKSPSPGKDGERLAKTQKRGCMEARADKGFQRQDHPFEAEHSERKRYIPASIRHQVILRDQGQCTYIDPVSGRRCNEKACLTFDHVKMFCHGGDHTKENWRVMCFSHTLLLESQALGEDFVENKIGKPKSQTVNICKKKL